MPISWGRVPTTCPKPGALVINPPHPHPHHWPTRQKKTRSLLDVFMAWATSSSRLCHKFSLTPPLKSQKQPQDTSLHPPLPPPPRPPYLDATLPLAPLLHHHDAAAKPVWPQHRKWLATLGLTSPWRSAGLLHLSWLHKARLPRQFHF